MSERAAQLPGRDIGLPARLLITAARFYQATLSRYLGGQCRFHPSCSEYFIQAVRARGAILGGAMGAWRILRCNPFSAGGCDLPPEAPDTD